MTKETKKPEAKKTKPKNPPKSKAKEKVIVESVELPKPKPKRHI